MQRRPLFWLLLSLLFLGGALYFWHFGDKPLADEKISPTATQAGLTQPKVSTNSPAHTPLIALPKGTGTNQTNLTVALHPYRLTNTKLSAGEMVHNEKGILLENAYLDTSKPMDLAIPDRLKAPADNGTYVVQSRGAASDAQFLAMLHDANATIVSYIPNNAWLVRVSDAGAQQLSANPQTQSVLPYEPYYKLDESLLKMAMEQPSALPGNSRLNLTLFPDAYQPTLDALKQLGAQVVTVDRSPFGPLVTVQAVPGSLSAIATLPGVQGVGASHARKQANDLARPRLNVAVDSVTPTNYLGLSGSNVLISINDGTVDGTHPDLEGRLTSDFPSTLDSNAKIDNGHGTHVTGTILGSGLESPTVTNAIGSVSNANFRGMAPSANGFVMLIDSHLDSDLQQGPALTNALISNNSWNYGADPFYDIAAASYDAAVRDAIPGRPGPQPVLFIFSAGNGGGGFDDGTGGNPDTILSPATAKNVITVGAIESPRFIPSVQISSIILGTNGEGSNVMVTNYVTNNIISGSTDNPSQVASFSGRGNVGIQVEGDFGRFKPDVVAPGTFVISDRPKNWNTNDYYNPVVQLQPGFYTNNLVGTNASTTNAVNTFLTGVPDGTVRIIITLETNELTRSNLPSMPIYVAVNNFPTHTTGSEVGTNRVVLLPSGPVPYQDEDTLYFQVGNSSPTPVNYDVRIDYFITNDVGNFYQVLQQMNDSLGTSPEYYRYESGTSMAAAGVSGLLANIQEFFQTKLNVTNSPALMKALLINGAHTVSDQYDYAVSNTAVATLQGWGLPSLPNSLPPAFTNLTSGNLNTMPLQFFDQSPSNAVATGQSFTRNLTLTPDGSLQELRVTLVWTDPPGNPVAGVKLVNDLDLIVSNVDTGEVFYGNDFPVGSTDTQPTETNVVPHIDSINNVENVYLAPPLGTNYSITVFGRRVNVNAVTTDNTGVVQDYALVISSGDATSLATSPFTLVDANNGVASTNLVVSNLIVLSNAVPLLDQRVGANSQYTGSTNGTNVQWNFYVYTNTLSLTNAAFTNVAFVTFDPPNLGVPRMGASGELGPPNPDATRFAGADIDLYVSTDSTLTNLNPAAVSNAFKAFGRQGDEVVYFTNSTPGQVYYVGVKSEDQQAAQFDLIGFATQLPFSQVDSNGNVTVNMNTVPLTIPGGLPTSPASAFLFGICINPVQVRKVVVTNDVTAQNFGDYIGSLSVSGASASAAVLNNHSFFTNVNDASEILVYDDSGEGEFPGALTSAGPGSLRNFVGVNGASTAWRYTIVNDSSQFHTGTINNMTLRLEPEYPPNSGYHKLPALAGNSWYYGFVDVPANATNLTVAIAGNTGPIDLFLRRGDFPSFAQYDKYIQVPTPGGSLSISKYETPPLNAGRYYFAVHTINPEANLSLLVELDYGLTAVGKQEFLSVGNELLLDDAVNYSTVHVSQDNTVVSAEVGVRLDHPRESDLVLTLISPQGTRVLLAENRGGLDTNGYGNGTNTFLVLPTVTSGSGSSANTNIVDVGANSGVLSVSYDMQSIADQMVVYYDGALIFDTGNVANQGSFSVPFGPGSSTSIEIIMNPFGNPEAATVWSYTAFVEEENQAYAFFSEDTNMTTLPIKFATPPFGGQPGSLATHAVVSNSFETVPAGNYGLGTTVEGWSVIATNLLIAPTVPAVVTAPAFADTGSNVLALHNGTITQTLPTKAGRSYTLAFANHGRPSVYPVSWWKAEGVTPGGQAADSADGNALSNEGPEPVTYAPGVVGQAFVLNENVKLRAPDAPNMVLTNAVTVEGWINPFSANTSAIIQRGDSRGGFDPYNMGVAPPTLGGQADLQWQVTDVNNNATLLAGPINLNTFTHVAGTYSFDGTNGTMALYLNGQQVAFVTNAVQPLASLISALSPGLGVGNRGDDINGFAFTGMIDELALYGTSLTAQQVGDIYAAGSAGKNPIGYTPNVTAQVFFAGTTNTISGIDEWTHNTYTFVAPADNMTITIVPNEDGMLIDTFQLIQNAVENPANFYLPEESLDKLVSEDSKGDWQLEILDNRAGATNPAPNLISWELRLQLADKVPLAIPLNPSLGQSNVVVPPGQFVYFQVDVPLWANFATNILTSSGPANLYFNQTTFPTGTNFSDVLLAPPSPFILAAQTGFNSNPQLTPGRRYYLGVQNPGTAAITISLEVDFDITTLTNAVAYGPTTIAPGRTQRYFQFDVSSNAVAALFQILNPTGNLELVASKGVPLPTQTNFDYVSAFPGTNAQNIIVITNSQPVPIGPGRWYLGVYNNDVTTVTYSIEATEAGPPNIIVLSNAVPFVTNVPPGLPLTNFYLFTITNDVAAALFELNHLSGNADLTLQREAIPYTSPFFSQSFNPGTNNEQIVIRTNDVGTNLLGNWYLGVPNRETFNVNYTIRASVSTNGMLLPLDPISVGVLLPPPGTPQGPTLTWTSVLGESYEIQTSTDLINWVTIATVVATGDTMTYTDPTPTAGIPFKFYRVIQVP